MFLAPQVQEAKVCVGRVSITNGWQKQMNNFPTGMSYSSNRDLHRLDEKKTHSEISESSNERSKWARESDKKLATKSPETGQDKKTSTSKRIFLPDLFFREAMTVFGSSSRGGKSLCLSV